MSMPYLGVNVGLLLGVPWLDPGFLETYGQPRVPCPAGLWVQRSSQMQSH